MRYLNVAKKDLLLLPSDKIVVKFTDRRNSGPQPHLRKRAGFNDSEKLSILLFRFRSFGDGHTTAFFNQGIILGYEEDKIRIRDH